jgi:hypothetical protein
MYPFLLNMWVMGKVTEAKLQTYSPKYITVDELDMILATPQKE